MSDLVPGRWALTPAPAQLPEFINRPIVLAVNVLGLAIALLDIALAILNIAKAFALGLLDPLVAILTAIIDELERLVLDLREIGLYLHGDWYIMREWPPVQIEGGYQAYERRMIARLQDTSDPGRPNFTPSTATVGIFFYAGAPIGQLGRLARTVNALLSLFQPSDVNILPTPTNLKVGYGFRNAPLISLPASVVKESIARRGEPEIANLSWSLPTPSSVRPELPVILPPSSGYLIELSVFPEGLFLAWSAPLTDNTGVGEQNYRQGYYRDPFGNPIKLFGGADQIVANAGWNDTWSGGERILGSKQAYAVQTPGDSVPIPLELLRDQDRYLLQRTIYVPSGLMSKFTLNQRFTGAVRKEDLPFQADFERDSDGKVQVVPGSVRPPTTVYARVRAVSENITAGDQFRYEINPVYSEIDEIVTIATGAEFTDVGPPSQAVPIQFPTSVAKDYMRVLESAIVVMLLSRSDYAVSRPPGVPDSVELEAQFPTGLENVSLSLFGKSVTNPDRFFRKQTTSETFRREILRKARDISQRIYSDSGSLTETYMQSVIERAGPTLLDWKWSDSQQVSEFTRSKLPDATILESLEDPFAEKLQGVIRNPNSVYDWGKSSNTQFQIQVERAAESRGFGVDDAISRSGISLERADVTPMVFAADENNSPAISRALGTGEFWTCRELIDSEVYDASGFVLQVAGASLEPVQGQWIPIRVVPGGIPAVEAILEEVLAWARTFRAGVGSLSDAIVEYIGFLESRLTELQEFLRRLQSWLRTLETIRVPQASALVVIGNGTQGIVDGLVNSSNKPISDQETYGAGVVLVGGGVPNIAIDIANRILG